jgi:large subunit ribosomal protein L22
MATLEASATNKYIRTSAQKAKLVLDLIRGKKAGDALSILRFTKKSIARDIEKTLRSAIANAVLVADRNQKRRLDEEDLVVSACYAGQGPSQKRVRPAPMGRAYRIRKRTNHVTIVVEAQRKAAPATRGRVAGRAAAKGTGPAAKAGTAAGGTKATS